jgi:transcriptional regulator with XRE-family HTH domain
MTASELERERLRETGGRLRQIRGERSQKEFAELLGIGRTTLIRYESGERQIDVDLLLKLNVIFRLQPLWLLTGKGEVSGGTLLNSREAALLDNYRNSPEDAREALEKTSAAFAQSTGPAKRAGAKKKPDRPASAVS